MRSWLDDWESEATQAREAMAAAAADDYKFAENNPFLNVSQSTRLLTTVYAFTYAPFNLIPGL